MIHKVAAILCAIALARAGIVVADYSPATSVSTASSSIGTGPVFSKYPVLRKPVHTYYYEPAPVYEANQDNKLSILNAPDGTYASYLKSLDSAYSNFNKFETHTIKDDGFIMHPFHNRADYTPIMTNPRMSSYKVSSTATNNLPSFVTKSVSAPVSVYTTPSITKTLDSPTYATSVLSTPGLSYTFNSHVQTQPSVKSVIKYSQSPTVAHMMFTGLGTSYSW